MISSSDIGSTVRVKWLEPASEHAGKCGIVVLTYPDSDLVAVQLPKRIGAINFRSAELEVIR